MKKEVVAILHDMRSVYNTASLFRTADGAGVSKLYLCGTTPTPFDRLGKARKDFIKVSLGAEKSVAWEYVKNTRTVLHTLKKSGFIICAIEQSSNSIPYYSYKPKKQDTRVALMVGNEVNGIAPSLLKCADYIFEIPMHGTKESLNVGVAFGVVAYRLRYPK